MRILTLVFGLVLSLAACAQQADEVRYTDGVHYKTLPQAVKTVTPGKIEVTEAFSYTCGHCFNFEPRVIDWAKKVPGDVQLVKLPVIWRASMQPLARIMYTGEALNMSEVVNAKFFDAVHKERKNIGSETAIGAIFKELGVSEDKFKKTFNSFGVSAKVQQADARTRSMKITGTPQMIIDGRYSVSATKELGHEGMLEVVDFLIEKVRAEKSSG